MKKMLFVFLIMGVLPTIIALMLHPIICQYDMNLFCYIKCNIPLVLGAAFALVSTDGDDQ